MACKLPEAITKIEEILSKNGEGIASAMLSGIQINMLNEAKNNLQSAIEIGMSRMQNTTPGSESKKSIHPSLSGKIILANSGIGKSYAKRIYNNIVDGDDLFRDAANFILEKYNQSKYKIDSVSNMRGVFELWGEYSSDIDKVTEAKKRRDEVYRKYAEFAKESSKNGMTVLSSSAREPIISIADFAIVQNDAETIAKNRSSELRENKEELSVEKSKEKIEAFKTKVSGIKTINLGKDQYISEILENGVTSNGSESIDSTKKDFRSEFKNKRPSAAKWADKEVAKFDVATQAISYGTNNSTAGFVKDFYGDKANTGTYTKDDVIYLSTNGNRTGRVIPVKNGVLQGAYKNIDKAIEAGAKFVADTSKHLASTGKYNVGEVELAEYLQSKGYAREDKDGYGLWSLITSSIQNETKSLEPEIKHGSVVKTNLSSRQLELVENAVSKSKDIGMALIKISNSSEKDEYGRTFREMSIPAKEKLEEAIKIHEKFNKTQDKKVETNKESTLSEELEYLNNKNTFKGKATQKSQIIEYVLSSGNTSFGIVHKMLDGTKLVYDIPTKVVNELSTGLFVNGSGKERLKKSFESAITVLKNLTDEKKEKLKKRLNEEGLKNKEINTFLKAGIDEKVRDIKISYEDLEILKKENEKLTKKTGVSIKWIENDANSDFNYNPDDNSVTYVEGFNDTITTVLQNHELKHALTFQYLKNNENDPKVAELIIGVSDFNDRLINLRAKESMNYKKDDSESYISKTNDLYERVDYMLKNSTDSKISNELRQVSEIVAILSAEKDIRDQFLNEFKLEEKSKLKRLLEWIKSKLNFSEVKTEYYFSPENIVKNVDEIVKQSSKEYKKNKEDSEQSELDVYNNKYKTISKDDIEAAKDIMSNNKKECE